MKKISTERLIKWRHMLSWFLITTMVMAFLTLVVLAVTISIIFDKFTRVDESNLIGGFGIYAIVAMTIAFILDKISKEISSREIKKTVMDLNTEQPKKIKLKKLNNVIFAELVKNSEIEAKYNEEDDTVIIIFNFADESGGKVSKTIQLKREIAESHIQIV